MNVQVAARVEEAQPPPKTSAPGGGDDLTPLAA